jgi:hypothetical protein
MVAKVWTLKKKARKKVFVNGVLEVLFLHFILAGIYRSGF